MDRLKYPRVAPEGYAALSGFGHYVNTATALEPVLLGLVYLRASVLNGCHFCIESHKTELRRHHEPESRIAAVSTAPDSEAFTPREQAALRWTQLITELRGQEVPDAEYAAVSRFFHEKDLVDLTFAIANINAWNRMGVAFQPQWRSGGAPAVASPEPPPVQEKAQKVATTEPTGRPEPEGKDAAPQGAEDDGGKVAYD